MAPTVVQNIDPSITYKHCLSTDNRLYFRITAGVYAVPHHDELGAIIKYKYRIVQHLDEDLFDCTCEQDRCLHVEAVELLYPRYEFHNEETHLFKETVKICQLFNDAKADRQIFGVYSEPANSFGVIKQTKAQIICLSCTQKPQSCYHRKVYTTLKPEANIAIHRPREFHVISKEPIPYPLESEEDIDTFNGYFLGVKYPDELFPEYDEDKKCKCGYRYNSDNPEASGWISCMDAVLHTTVVDIEVTTYYRPTLGNCKCRQEYDGRQDLIININNKHLFTYDWLIKILHNTQATRYPLYSGFVSSNMCRIFSGSPARPKHQYDILRMAYNAFIRLLTFDDTRAFSCEKCGNNIDIVVIDATAVGFNINQMPPASVEQLPLLQIPEYGGGDRVFVADSKARKLLAMYAGLIKGEYVKNHTAMEEADFNSLKRLLAQRNQALRDVIIELGNPCPEPLRELVGELSRSSATSGLFQFAGEEARAARHVIEEIANGNFANLEASFDVIQKYCPLVTPFLNSSDIIPQECISSLMKEILSSIDGIFRMQMPEADKYGPIEYASDDLEKFPVKLVVRGRGNYQASKELLTNCNKSTTKKRTLSSGIFTFFCQHGICYGFQLMRTPESPRIPFDILMRRFQTMPRIIVYDNACKLHTYCLKREPARFKDTKFLVDRLHFRNHVGCSLGYSMNTYTSDEEIREINSQVCEQANSDLRLLATQIAHMTPHNAMRHLSVFLSIRNGKKHVKMRKSDRT